MDLSMKLYEATVIATVTDLETLNVSLAIEVDVSSELQTTAMKVMPAHLRKMADDIEKGQR